MQIKFVLLSLACLLSASACAHGRVPEAQLCMAQRSAVAAGAPSVAEPALALQGRAYVDAYPLLDEPASEWKAPERAYAQEEARTGL